MKNILGKLIEHASLSRDEARKVLLDIADGKCNDCQLAAFMTVYLMRSITLDELIGFRDAILERRLPVEFDRTDAIDIVGTGGDGKNTFNISTVTCFVVAGTGRRVIKHGNYGASSVSGAFSVLEHHGVRFTTDESILRRSLDESGVCYLHAPLFSPALKSVASARRQLGIRTFFNMLGPLVNPMQPRHQLMGVYSLGMMRMYHYISQYEGIECTVVHSLDGYDEISLTSPFKVASVGGERVYCPADLGFALVEPGGLYGGDTVAEASAVFDKVLAGEGSRAQTECVLANAAFAIHTLEPHVSLLDAVEQARESIASGRAVECFRKFLDINKA